MFCSFIYLLFCDFGLLFEFTIHCGEKGLELQLLRSHETKLLTGIRIDTISIKAKDVQEAEGEAKDEDEVASTSLVCVGATTCLAKASQEGSLHYRF